MEKQSIAFRLSLYVILTVCITITVVVYLNYDFSKKVLMQNIEEAAINQSGLIIGKVSRHIVSTQEISKNLVEQTPYYLMHGDLNKFIEGVVKANEVLYGISAEIKISETERKFISVKRSKNDQVIFLDKPFNQIFNDFAKSIDKEGKWSQPFYCNDRDSVLLISYFKPLFNHAGEKIGVVSSEISLDFLNKMISGIRLGEHGFSFIVASSGMYITHPVEEWIMKRSIKEISSKVFKKDMDAYYEQLYKEGSLTDIAYPELLDFEKSWFYAATIPHTDWIIIIVSPYKELFKDMEIVFRKIILISGLGIIIVLLIILFLFRRLLSPLMQLIKSLQNFSFYESTKKKKNEIDLLNESLAALQTQYSLHLKEQTKNKKDRKKYERDIKSARDIQTTIIPKSNPNFPKEKNIELYAELHPAEVIGGDLYDYFFIDSKHLLFTMGDVSGKGIPAALFMAVALTLIKSKATIPSASKIMELVNDELSKQNTNQHFITLFIGVLNIDSGVLTYCNAAHNYPYVIRNESEIEVLDIAHGLPLGVYAKKTYTEDSIELQPGDSIMLYTDGVIDCKDENEQTYGVERLYGNVSQMLEHSPKGIVKRLLKSLKLFKGGEKPADDISVMVVRFLKDDEK